MPYGTSSRLDGFTMFGPWLVQVNYAQKVPDNRTDLTRQKLSVRPSNPGSRAAGARRHVYRVVAGQTRLRSSKHWRANASGLSG